MLLMEKVENIVAEFRHGEHWSGGIEQCGCGRRLACEPLGDSDGVALAEGEVNDCDRITAVSMRRGGGLESVVRRGVRFRAAEY